MEKEKNFAGRSVECMSDVRIYFLPETQRISNDERKINNGSMAYKYVFRVLKQKFYRNGEMFDT